MKTSTFFKGQYLRAIDVADDPFVGIIRAVKTKEFDDGQKLIVELEVGEDTEQVVLNKTRQASLVAMFGTDESDAWILGRVKVFCENTSYKGERVASIAFGAPEEKTTTKSPDQITDPPKTPPITDADIPF